MKKILIVVASIATMSLSSFGQGTFNMVWYDGANGITVAADHNQHSTGWFVGSEYSAIAYLGGSGSAEDALQPLAATLTAFDLTGPTADGKLAADGAGQFYAASRIMTSLALGNAAIQIRAWYNGGLYATYEDALAAGANVGKSGVMTINLKDNLDPSGLSLTDIGMPAFSVGTTSVVPEPSTMVLAGLGAASLLMFRRRK